MNKTNDISNYKKMTDYNKMVVLHLAHKYPNEFLKKYYEYKDLVDEKFLSAAIDRAKSILENVNEECYFGTDEIAMTVYLLDSNILFVGSAISDNGEKTSGLYISINDHFGPGADSETIEPHEIPKLYKLYMQKKHSGVVEFVANKRKISTESWIEKLKNEQESTPHEIQDIIDENFLKML